jgi:hypothetical protein
MPVSLEGDDVAGLQPTVLVMTRPPIKSQSHLHIMFISLPPFHKRRVLTH